MKGKIYAHFNGRILMYDHFEWQYVGKTDKFGYYEINVKSSQALEMIGEGNITFIVQECIEQNETIEKFTNILNNIANIF